MLLVIATLLFALTPVTIHAPIALVEVLVLVSGLAVMLAANVLLLRPTVLTGVLLQLDSLAGVDPDERRREVAGTKQALRQALEEVRRIAQELRPEVLEHLGLASSLTELSSKFADLSGISVERRFAPGLPPLSAEAELTIYRVAQEPYERRAARARAADRDGPRARCRQRRASRRRRRPRLRPSSSVDERPRWPARNARAGGARRRRASN
jgi:hypothetical protein